MRFKKILVTLSVLVCMLGNMVATASAASSDTWSIHYIPGAPSNISNQSDTLYVAYYSEGYIGECTSFSGSRGANLKITSTSVGGIKTYYGEIEFWGVGVAFWEMWNSTTGSVCFKVMADGTCSCTSTGIIRIADFE